MEIRYWGAGIRTLIPRTKTWCPAIGRPPNGCRRAYIVARVSTGGVTSLRSHKPVRPVSRRGYTPVSCVCNHACASAGGDFETVAAYRRCTRCRGTDPCAVRTTAVRKPRLGRNNSSLPQARPREHLPEREPASEPDERREYRCGHAVPDRPGARRPGPDDAEGQPRTAVGGRVSG